MTDKAANEKTYLFVDDYGMGGVWIYVIASTPSDVTKKYPKLRYVSTKPSWLIEHEKNNSLAVYSIDANPDELAYLQGGAVDVRDL